MRMNASIGRSPEVLLSLLPIRETLDYTYLAGLLAIGPPCQAGRLPRSLGATSKIKLKFLPARLQFTVAYQGIGVRP